MCLKDLSFSRKKPENKLPSKILMIEKFVTSTTPTRMTTTCDSVERTMLLPDLWSDERAVHNHHG